MGGNALSFLGLSEPTNRNRRRLLDFYQGETLPAWLIKP